MLSANPVHRIGSSKGDGDRKVRGVGKKRTDGKGARLTFRIVTQSFVFLKILPLYLDSVIFYI